MLGDWLADPFARVEICQLKVTHKRIQAALVLLQRDAMSLNQLVPSLADA